jgi:hypothetical protein
MVLIIGGKISMCPHVHTHFYYIFKDLPCICHGSRDPNTINNYFEHILGKLL